MKKLTPILLLILSCSSPKTYKSVVFNSLKTETDQKIRTTITDTTRFVFQLGLIIEGNIENEGILKIGIEPGERFDKIKLKKGIINKTIEMDWYEPEAILRYSPASLKDSLKIQYYFRY